MPSDQLVKGLRRLVDHGNALTAELLCHMGEVDARKLYLESACPSMFVYCTDILKMSEGQCYKRIRAARLARKFPDVLSMVHSGQVHLCAVSLLAPHMTRDNCDELLQQAVHKSKRQVEKLMAQRFPSPPVRDVVRKLPGRSRETGKDTQHQEPLLRQAQASPRAPSALSADTWKDNAAQRPERAATDPMDRGASTTRPMHSPGRPRGRVAPLSTESYKIQLTAGQPLHDKLRQAQELLKHQVPDGDLATVFERALDALLPQLQKQRFAQVATPRKSTKARGARAKTERAIRQDGKEDNASNETAGDGAVEVSRGVQGKRSRHIPAEVKRKVAERDGFQCTYTDKTGRRCPERGLVEFHHVQPFGKDGNHEEANVQLLCKAHNAHAARSDYGEQVMERWRGDGHDGFSTPTVPGDSWQLSLLQEGAASTGTVDTG